MAEQRGQNLATCEGSDHSAAQDHESADTVRAALVCTRALLRGLDDRTLDPTPEIEDLTEALDALDELVAESDRLRERLEEVKRLASDPFASEAVALRACLLTAYEGLGLPGPEPSPERDIAKAIIKEHFG